MNNYYDNLNNEIKEYFNILSNEFPDWLLDYINTPEMQRIHKISMSCGTDYSKCFNLKYWYSNLDHSVAVALIIWNFTHDKKQALSGLLHDIATPVFKHCIDFMNGDSETQESTEEKTIDIIKNSNEIMYLLNRDGINIEDVQDYKKYPIADNNMPRLSADRFEYNFSSGLTFFRVWDDLNKIRKVYNNITIGKNENNIDEFVFKDKEVCEEYINIISKLWPQWINDADKIVMQFLADICKSMSNAGFLTIDDLYNLSEKEVIEKILNCEDSYLSDSFKKFQGVDKVYSSPVPIENKYCVNVKSKVRYVNPLVQTKNGNKRIYEISNKSKQQIDNLLNNQKQNYIYFDFDFKPYNYSKQKVLKKHPSS